MNLLRAVLWMLPVSMGYTLCSHGPVTAQTNAPPTLDAIANQVTTEDTTLTLNLTGISGGSPEYTGDLAVTATVQPYPSTTVPSATATANVNYTSPQSTGILTLTPASDSFGLAVVKVTVTKGQTNTNDYATFTRSFTVDFRPVNDAPTLDALPNLTINEDSGPLTVNLSGISSGAANENQVLNVSASISFPPSLLTSSTIPVTYTSPQTSGTLTLNLLANASGTSTVSVRVYDGVVTTTRTFTLTIVPVNDAPTLTTMLPLRSTNEDQPYTVFLSALTFEGNEADVDGPSMNFRIEQVLSGTLTQNGQPIVPGQTLVTANQSVIWTPPANQNGDIAAFTVRAWDTIAASATPVTVSVRVNPINDAPVAQTFTGTTPEDTPLNFTLSATDVEGSPLTFTITQQPAASVGTITGSSPNFTFTPAPNYWGNGSFAAFFAYSVSDGSATVSRSGNTITITSVNDAPTLTDINTITGFNEDSKPVISFSMLSNNGNPADPDGPSYSFRIESVASGTITQNGQPVVPGQTLITSSLGVTWTPPLDANGLITACTVRAYDGTLASATAVPVVFNLNPVNDYPRVQPQKITIVEDTPTPLDLPASDPDGQPVTYVFSNLRPGSSVTGTAPNFVYTPADNFHGFTYFSYTASDGTLTAGPVYVDVTVTPVNDAPTLTKFNPLKYGSEDSPYTVSLSILNVEGDEINIDGPQGLTYRIEEVVAGTLTQNGQPVVPGQTFVTANQTVVWTPPANLNGDVIAFKVRAYDGELFSSEAVPVPVHLNPGNDAPIANGGTFNGVEDEPFQITLDVSDIDGDKLTYQFFELNGATMAGAGPTFTYTSAPNRHGQTSFAYQVFDGFTYSNYVRVTVNLQAVNDAPTLSTMVPFTGKEDLLITITHFMLLQNGDEVDVDNPSLNPPLAFRIEEVLSGTLSKNGVPVEDGDIFPAYENIQWKPPANANGPITAFTVKAWDGSLASATAVPVVINVAPVNDAPVVQNPSATTPEDTAVDFTVEASDVDGDALTYSIAQQPAASEGVISGDGPGFTFAPADNFNGVVSFILAVSDGQTTALKKGVITVTAVNDAPQLSSIDPLSGALEDTPFTITPAALEEASDIFDVDGPVLRFKVVAIESGTLTVNGIALQPGHVVEGNLIWTAPANAHGELTAFTVVAWDGSLDSGDPIAVQVEVESVSDQPVAEEISVGTDEDIAIDIALSGSDVDGDALTFGIVDAPQHGTLTGTAPNLVYTPDADFNGTDTFTYRAHDGALDSTPATVTITVAPINDAPRFTISNSALQIRKNAKQQVLPGFITGISPGPQDEANQTLSFTISNDNPTVFAEQPTLSADGTLTLVPNKGRHGRGTATVTVIYKDNGGTANNGVDTTTKTFTIEVEKIEVE
jgi:hypothetical protein